MAFWSTRGELSRANRLRRSYYELLRDEMDQFLIQYALLDSYNNFIERNIPYPFVEKRELKPRALLPDLEYECQNAFLTIFIEDSIPSILKKYIRFFDVNRTTKTNLLRSKTLPTNEIIEKYYKHLDSARFFDFLGTLLPVDYALLIQRTPATRASNGYVLSHFHVRIDWPIADAAEDLGRNLRYISKDLYEKGDKYAEDIQKKFFEYYGLPVMVGGRRTAAIVAAQYLRRLPCISTIYAGSSESRALMRLSEDRISKTILMKFDNKEVGRIAEANNLPVRTFKKSYMVAREGHESLYIFHTTYKCTSHALPPDDGKLRELKPDLNWRTVDTQHILPKPGVWKYPPLPMNIIYS
ncbi:hypothetical protein QUF76_13915 [Desulfobacterales bacterium HSG16]|nr:hypothetical protein [Desulfobacterales bacterium HSG16]